MKIYVAASFPRRDEARLLGLALEDAGHEITSGWMMLKGKSYFGDDWAGEVEAVRDLQDVRDCDVLVSITGDTESHGGRHSELGIALALGKRIIIVGPKEQVFHHHPHVEEVSGTSDVLESLECQRMERTSIPS